MAGMMVAPQIVSVNRVLNNIATPEPSVSESWLEYAPSASLSARFRVKANVLDQGIGGQ